MSEFWRTLSNLAENHPQGAALTFLAALGMICWTTVKIVRGILEIFEVKARTQVVMAERMLRMQEARDARLDVPRSQIPARAVEPQDDPPEPAGRPVSVYEHLRRP